MRYKVTLREEATRYEAKGHYDVRTTRLHNPTDIDDGTVTMGLSHFLPGGGAEMSPARSEMVYYIVEGEMTITLKGEDGTEETRVLRSGDSIHFAAGVERAICNTGLVATQMLVIGVKH